MDQKKMPIGYDYGKKNLEKIAFPIVAPALRFGSNMLKKYVTGGYGLKDTGRNLVSGAKTIGNLTSSIGQRFYNNPRKLSAWKNVKLHAGALGRIPQVMTNAEKAPFKAIAKGVGVGTGMYLGNKAYNASMGEAKQREQDYKRIAQEQALDRQRMNQQMSQGM